MSRGARRRVPGLMALTLLVLAGSTACSGDEDEPGVACGVTELAGLQTLVDDRGALPAANLVTVLGADEGFRPDLVLLDPVSRTFSQADLAALVAADDRATLEAAVSDVEPGTAQGELSLVVTDDPVGAATGAYYEAALARSGVDVTLEQAPDAARAVDRLGGAGADAAVLGLGDLAATLDLEALEGDASSQVQQVATAALEQDLALGSTAAATDGPRLVTATGVVDGSTPSAVSALADACAGGRVVALEGQGAAAEQVAQAYGLEVAGDEATSVEEAFSEPDVVLVVQSAGDGADDGDDDGAEDGDGG